MTKTNVRVLISSLLLCFLPAVIGSLATNTTVNTWFPSLVKPGFQPPNWLFAPVWTVLYLLQGLSLYLVRTSQKTSDIKMMAYVFFTFQLFFNLLWSILFFLLKSPGAALIEIGLLDICVIFTLAASYRANKTTFFLLLPYLGWIFFATWLNLQIFILNRV